MRDQVLPGSRSGRSAVLAAVAVWLGALCGLGFGFVAIGIGGGVAVGGALLRFARREVVLLVLLAAGAASGTFAAQRVETTLGAPVPEGTFELRGRVAEEPTPAFCGVRFLFHADAIAAPAGWAASHWPPLVVYADVVPDVTAGDLVAVAGKVSSDPGFVRGDAVAGTVDATDVVEIPGGERWLFLAGNALRHRVASQLAAHGAGPREGLLAGFLIGDTSGLSPGDAEALRLAGLTHFVAVSGSNVALFLAAWWLVAGPLAMRPRMRAILGLGGLALFVVVTRWEPSVIRAASMAALVLGGRIVGVPLDTWSALGGAVTLLLLFSGQLALDVGFQLSAAATAGVLLGGSLLPNRRPRWIWATLGATIGAQGAVLPLLLFHFGAVPLLSPLANLLAAPLVAAATAVAGIGVVSGLGFLVGIAARLASVVLAIAHAASNWPQLDWISATAVVLTGLLASRRKLRPVVTLGVAGAIAAFAIAPVSMPREPLVTFLDVGQGDSVLLRDPSGAAALVDGGSDPLVLSRALRRYGVDALDLVVVTHGDADHVAGLQGLADAVPIQQLWVTSQRDAGELMRTVVSEAAAAGIPVVAPPPGHRLAIGSFVIAVLGPTRRYAADNDGSVILWVESGGVSALLAGDIEAVSQRELQSAVPDLLLVPHHGSATTDVAWLRRTAGPVAVISVGQNSYGHPSDTILSTLAEMGTRVYLTRELGDITIPFKR